MSTQRSISPDSLQSSVSGRSTYTDSCGSVGSGSSSSAPIHPTLFIRDPRRKNYGNVHGRHQLTESDFGFRLSTSLSTKIRRLLSNPAHLPKALFNRKSHLQPSVDRSSSLCQTSSSPSAHHRGKSMEHLFLDPSPEKWRAINRISSIAKPSITSSVPRSTFTLHFTFLAIRSPSFFYLDLSYTLYAYLFQLVC